MWWVSHMDQWQGAALFMLLVAQVQDLLVLGFCGGCSDDLYDLTEWECFLRLPGVWGCGRKLNTLSKTQIMTNQQKRVCYRLSTMFTVQVHTLRCVCRRLHQLCHSLSLLIASSWKYKEKLLSRLLVKRLRWESSQVTWCFSLSPALSAADTDLRLCCQCFDRAIEDLQSWNTIWTSTHFCLPRFNKLQ